MTAVLDHHILSPRNAARDLFGDLRWREHIRISNHHQCGAGDPRQNRERFPRLKIARCWLMKPSLPILSAMPRIVSTSGSSERRSVWISMGKQARRDAL